MHACIIVALALITFIAYWPVRAFEFVNYDDVGYVVNNHRVVQGLTFENLIWAFTAGRLANWHPVTWLSYMTDATIFGKHAGAFHMVNVVFHAANTVVFYLILRRLSAVGGCGSLWRCGLAAALFALHPLHVESVAWVSERKDVLSTLFGLLAVWCYVGYVQRPSISRYLLIAVWFALSLMSKPMLVTMPAALLLLDYWPLRRWRLVPHSEVHKETRNQSKPVEKTIIRAGESATRLILEKLPLVLLAVASSVITVMVQRHGGAMRELTQLPMDLRLANAVVAYMHYVVDSLWPAGLAVLYPHPGHWPPLEVFLAVVVLIAVTATAFVFRRRYSHLLVGWLLFIGTLVPVIGIVQVGEQTRADRYMYVPLIGLIVMAVWSVPRPSKRGTVAALTSAAIMVLGAYLMVTWRQVGVWKNTRSLFEHALSVTSNNYTAHNNLGMALILDDEFDQAKRHFEEAVRINDRYPEAQTNLADAYVTLGQHDQAMEHYQAALRAQPSFGLAHNGLAALYGQRGDLSRAIEHFEAARRWDRYVPNVQHNLGKLYAASGQTDKAVEMYGEALDVAPDKTDVHLDLAVALMAQQDNAGAIEAYRHFIASNPDHAMACHNLAMLLIGQPHFSPVDLALALDLARRACDLTQHQAPEMLYALGLVQMTAGDYEAALKTGQRALELARAAGDQSLTPMIESFLEQLRDPNAANPSQSP